MIEERSSERLPPYSEEAERASVGSMMLDPLRVIPIARGNKRLTAEMFYMPSMRVAVAGCFALMDSGTPPDLVTLTEHLRMTGKLEQIGGFVTLSNLVDECAAVQNAEYYLEIVRQKYILRALVVVARDLEREAYQAEDGEQLLQDAPRRMLEIIDESVKQASNATVMDEVIENWEHPKQGLHLPYPRLDKMMCGLGPGIIILAGRPSQGKTTLEDCLALCLSTMEEPVPIGRVTMDMDQKRLMQRALCRHGGVSLSKLMRGHANHVDIEKVKTARDFLADAPVYINDWDYDIAGICAWARAMVFKHGIKVLTIDYVQQIQIAGRAGDRLSDNENGRITIVSRELKRLALQLQIPILVLSQLRRGADTKDHVPDLDDLRGSGSLEQDARQVLLVYEDPDGTPMGKGKNWTDTIVHLAKSQDGPTGAVDFKFLRHYFLFEEKPAPMEEGELEGDGGLHLGELGKRKNDDVPWIEE